MGALYPGTTVSGYNSNPPPDDGTTVSTNQLTWVRDIKGKIGDPLNTFASSVNTNITNAFNKTLSGGSVVSTATSYGATSADQGRIIVGTASGITVTTPDATSVLSPFVFAVNNQSSGNITVAGFSSQNIDGANTAKIGKGRGIILWTDGSNWFSSGLVMGNLPLANPPFGFDAPINLQLNATVASNLLTIAVKANDGTDPTSSNPVLIPFRDSTIANGGPIWVAVTAALSINTNAVGATLGTANTTAFRLWVLAFNNAGTVVLALWQSVTGGGSPTAVAPLYEGAVQSTTGISAAATSAGTFYTPNGTNLTNKSFRIIGYVDYANGLTTAGTYASAPTTVQLFGPGIKKPGDIVQSSYFTLGSAQGGVGSTTYVTSNLTTSITPTSTPNLVYATASGSVSINTTSDAVLTRLSRGNSSNTNMIGSETINSSTNGLVNNGFSVFALDAPGTVSSQAYNLQTKVNNGAASSVLCPSSTVSAIRVDEIMA